MATWNKDFSELFQILNRTAGSVSVCTELTRRLKREHATRPKSSLTRGGVMDGVA